MKAGSICTWEKSMGFWVSASPGDDSSAVAETGSGKKTGGRTSGTETKKTRDPRRQHGPQDGGVARPKHLADIFG